MPILSPSSRSQDAETQSRRQMLAPSTQLGERGHANREKQTSVANAGARGCALGAPCGDQSVLRPGRRDCGFNSWSALISRVIRRSQAIQVLDVVVAGVLAKTLPVSGGIRQFGRGRFSRVWTVKDEKS